MDTAKSYLEEEPIQVQHLTTDHFDGISDFLNNVMDCGDPISVYLVSELWNHYPELMREAWEDKVCGKSFKDIHDMADFMTDWVGFMAERRYR